VCILTKKDLFAKIVKSQKKIIKILIVIIFYAAVAFLGASFTDISSDWYTSLILPAVQPPPAAFMYVWAFIYPLLTVLTSLVIINESFSNRLRNLLLAYGILNILWSYAFFTMQNPFGSIIILAVLLFIGYLIYKELEKIKPLYSYLFIPYLVWLTFSLFLNYGVLFLNPV
jgi:translocator protein